MDPSYTNVIVLISLENLLKWTKQSHSYCHKPFLRSVPEKTTQSAPLYKVRLFFLLHQLEEQWVTAIKGQTEDAQ